MVAAASRMATADADPRKADPTLKATKVSEGSPQRGPSARPPAADKRVPSRKGFQKERATLWLLSIALGLGLGTAGRFLHRADQARASVANAAPAVGTSQAQAFSAVPYQNQRVTVLPRPSYQPRATSRMS